jgi:hypothetical protein
VAADILRATDRARSSEHNVNWVSGLLLVAYRLVPAAFDAVVAPVMRLAGFSRRSAPRTAGSVFGPGRWPIPRSPAVKHRRDHPNTIAVTDPTDCG